MKSVRGLGLLTTLTLAGYPLWAAFISLAGGTESSAGSIVLRIGIATLGVGILLHGRHVHGDLRSRIFLICYAVFWTLYYTRIGVDAFIMGKKLPWTGIEYLGYATLFALLPTFGTFGARFDAAASRRCLRTALIVTVFALALAGLDLLRSAQDLASLTSERAGLERLNPISMGHLGVSLFIMAMCARHEGLLRGRIAAVLGYVLQGFALVAAGLSGSKGPAAALMVVLFLYYFLPATPGKRWGLIGILLLVVLALIGIAISPLGDEIAVIQRFADLLTDPQANQSNADRVGFFLSVINQYLEHPIVGDALVERTLGFYPHNLLLEAAMSMGTVGLVLAIVLLWLSLSESVRHLAGGQSRRWIHALNVQYACAFMVSGSIIAASQFWFMLCLAFFTARSLAPSKAATAGARGYGAGPVVSHP